MGLDNGIVINEAVGVKIPFWVKLEIYPTEYDGDIQVCYWRKCWNIRAEILGYLADRGYDKYMVQLDYDDVVEIRNIIKRLNRRKEWESARTYRGSIWSWDVAKKFLRRDLKNLKWLARCMQKDPDLYVYFYDSY